MGAEQIPQIDTQSEQAQLQKMPESVKNNKLEVPDHQEIEYLNFTSDEKADVLRKISEKFSSIDKVANEGLIDFPTTKKEIEEFIFLNPEHFGTKRLAEVALAETEFAPKLIREIADRKEYSQLEQILQQHKEKPVFKHCVAQIELSLKDEGMQESILMALSESLAKDDEAEKVAFEKFSEFMLAKPEKASRDLATYFDFLGISEVNAKKLLDKKNLLLIGGGIAPIKNELLERGIDCRVTNIEPLLKDNTRENSDQPISKNFYDVSAEEMGKHDEIWSANNSLPTYAFNPEQVKVFYQKALGAINPGGYLRVIPFQGFADSITPSMRLSRLPTSNESIRQVEALRKRPDLFEVEEFETPQLKSFFGKKNKMTGVNIRAIGTQEQINAFLKDISDKK